MRITTIIILSTLLALSVCCIFVQHYTDKKYVNELIQHIDYLNDEKTDYIISLAKDNAQYRKIKELYEWQLFTQALIIVESGMQCNAVGDNGSAIGILQIRPIMVKEYRRLTGDKSIINRKDPIQSLKIFKIVQSYHNREQDFKKACKVWNPTATDEYYNKVMKVFEQLKQISK